MHLVYYDESGDDGRLAGSSPMFILSCIYMDEADWRENYEILKRFKKRLYEKFKFPYSEEFHTRQFLLNSEPYYSMNISDSDRDRIMAVYCKTIALLKAKIINVAVLKTQLYSKQLDVLETAFKFSIQRIANDLAPDPDKRFLIITDEGRVPKMRRTTRKIQVYNVVPSKIGRAQQKPIKSLIEDPLPKNSKESFFLQASDLLSYIIAQYTAQLRGIGKRPKRLPAIFDLPKFEGYLTMLNPVLNLKASSDKFGIVYHPK